MTAEERELSDRFKGVRCRYLFTLSMLGWFDWFLENSSKRTLKEYPCRQRLNFYLHISYPAVDDWPYFDLEPSRGATLLGYLEFDSHYLCCDTSAIGGYAKRPVFCSGGQRNRTHNGV